MPPSSSPVMLAGAGMPAPEGAWFDPRNPALATRPVQQGGRGSAWFVHGPFGEGVLRHYLRGGAAAMLSRDQYLWSGEDDVRSIAELRLTERLAAIGLPVPAPVAAAYWRTLVGYRAAIIVRAIDGATTLASQLQRGEHHPDAWIAAGRMLARFHAAGLDHADLNAHNILFDADGAPWLIDFDKSHLLPAPDAAAAAANIERLQRSLRKVAAAANLEASVAPIEAALLQGYHGDAT